MPADPRSIEERGRRNLRVVSLTSFLTDVSSEMVLNLLPLFLIGPLGVRASIIGLIEGVAEATASLLKVASGALSDRLGERKRLAVAGYGISSLAKPLFLLAGSWTTVAWVRWLDRAGKGVRTAPRDALLADGAEAGRRGFTFGVHRAADTAGAAAGLAIALIVVAWQQGAAQGLTAATFRSIVLISIVPGVLAVVLLAALARDLPIAGTGVADRMRIAGAGPLAARRRSRFAALGRPFFTFLAIFAVFELGNAADAFVVLLADVRGLPVTGVLAMLLTMNVVYSATSLWGGTLADRVGRRPVLIAGWMLYAVVYFGFGQARSGAQVWTLAAVYGIYHGLTFGTARAMIADLVPAGARATAFGLFAAMIGVLDVPASLLAGLLWHGIGSWSGFGPSSAFFFGASMAALAAFMLLAWRPPARI